MQEYIKKLLGSAKSPLGLALPNNITALIISNDEMKDIIKIVKSIDDSGFLLKGVSETTQNEAKEQKGGFLSMLFGTLGAILLGNMLAGKGFIRAGYGSKKDKGVLRAGYGSKGSSIKKSFIKDF